MIVVRKEMPDDIAVIWKINEKAFGQPVEANIVDKLRENCSDLLSLVAVQGEQIVGHILFSPARIEGEREMMEGVGLAPMAVLPKFQRHGIGSRLVQEGVNYHGLKSVACDYAKNRVAFGRLTLEWRTHGVS